MSFVSPPSLEHIDQPSAQWLSQMLGVPVFESPWHMPLYPEGAVGPWRIVRGAAGLDRGYYSGACVTTGNTVLLRANDAGGWDTWMSLSPYEIESQELACRHAVGHTVVMGLGMGWVAANVALNPAVSKVTVVERDADVLDLFGRSKVLDGLPAQVAAKIGLVQADALEWTPTDAAVDFLYADIWLGLAEARALADVQRMQANVQASSVYFWGQELVLARLAQQQSRGDENWADALDQVVLQAQLPLLGEGCQAPWVKGIAQQHSGGGRS